jgi:DNA-binding IclR family transcriptional regulator
MWDYLSRGRHAGLTGRDVWLRSGLPEQRARAALAWLVAAGLAERRREGSDLAMGSYLYRLTGAGLAAAGRR